MKTRVIQNEPGEHREPTASTPSSLRSRAPNVVRHHPLMTFFMLTYAVTWSLWTPLVVAPDSSAGALGFVLAMLGSWAPSLVAILLVALLDGRHGVRKLLGRLLLVRLRLHWYVAVLLLSMLLPVGVAVSVAFGGNAPVMDATIASTLLLFIFFIFPGSALGEELGWRGFALPYLQRGHSALGASLVIGAVWGCWHLPLYLTGSDLRSPSIFPAFALAVVATSVICTWLYNSTGGSLLIVVLYHAAANLPLTLLLEPLGEQSARPFVIYLALLVVATVAIVAVTGPGHLSRTRPKQVAVP